MIYEIYIGSDTTDKSRLIGMTAAEDISDFKRKVKKSLYFSSFENEQMFCLETDTGNTYSFTLEDDDVA